MTATIDDIAKTLGEFEALAQKTGEWDGADPVEFSIDGVTWLPVWSAVGDWRFPPFARATVHRKGVAAPTVMVVAWEESLPADDDWRNLWERKPMKLFGSFALRSAIRHAFRDVVGDAAGPDEDTSGPSIGARVEAVARDWAAEYRAATSVEQLDDIRRECRAARENTMELQGLWIERRAALIAGEWTTPAPELSEEEAIRHRAFFEQPELPPGRTSIYGGQITRAPQDHLPPTNRAARRASKRKGRRG